MKLGFVLLMVWPIGACDSPGGGAKGFAPVDATNGRDGGGDALFTAPDVADVGVEVADTATTTQPTETRVDTSVPLDSAQPEVVSSVCAEGCLEVVPQAGPSVAFTQLPATVPPPTLTGGATPTGAWKLSKVEIFSQGTFVDGFEIQVSNEGDTRGNASFDGDAMQVALHLDLRIKVDAFGTVGEDTGSADVALGGCFEASDARLSGDLETCASGWPVGTTPPDALDYSLSGANLKLRFDLQPEFLIAMLPEDQRGGAELVIVGPLTLVATMVHP